MVHISTTRKLILPIFQSSAVSPCREELAGVEVGRAESRRGPELAQQVASGAKGGQGGWEGGTMKLHSTLNTVHCTWHE